MYTIRFPLLAAIIVVFFVLNLSAATLTDLQIDVYFTDPKIVGENTVIKLHGVVNSPDVEIVGILVGSEAPVLLKVHNVEGKLRLIRHEITYKTSEKPVDIKFFGYKTDLSAVGKPLLYQRGVSSSTAVVSSGEHNVSAPAVSTTGTTNGSIKILGTGLPLVNDSKYNVQIVPSFDMAHQQFAGQGPYYLVKVSQNGILINSTAVPVEIEPDPKNKSKTIAKRNQTVPVYLNYGDNSVEVSLLDSGGAALTGVSTVPFTVKCEQPCNSVGRNINSRAVMGFEQVGGSSTTGKVRPFLNFFLSVPLRVGNRHVAGEQGKSINRYLTPERFSFWTDFRLSSAPSQRFLSLKNITTDFTDPNKSFGENEVVQTFRVNTGLDFRIVSERSIIPFFEQAKTSLSLIAGGGVSAPLSQESRNVAEIFEIPLVNDAPSARFIDFYKRLRESVGKENRDVLPAEVQPTDRNIAFAYEDRVRFERRIFGGLRAKVQFYENRFRRADMSPAMFDLTFGVDESVTGRLGVPVMTFEGFTPFPIGGNDYIFIYGGVSTKLERNPFSSVPSIFLKSTAFNSATLESPTTIVVPGNQNPYTRSARDTYFFGVGIDFLRLFKKDKPATEAPKP